MLMTTASQKPTKIAYILKFKEGLSILEKRMGYCLIDQPLKYNSYDVLYNGVVKTFLHQIVQLKCLHLKRLIIIFQKSYVFYKNISWMSHVFVKENASINFIACYLSKQFRVPVYLYFPFYPKVSMYCFLKNQLQY